jgi:hypothetical protein
MQTECSAEPMLFARLDRRELVADFGGGAISSDAGALLLGATDRAIGLVERFAACFADGRDPGRVAHELPTLVGQRVFGIALGYEDLIDHDDLRRDPVLGAVLGQLEAKRPGLAPLAGKSTLNRLEHAPREGSGSAHRYHRIGHDPAAVEDLFVDLFLDAYEKPPARITLDLDATDDPIHGSQEGRFFHGYYDGYCYLPLYVFCGDHLLAAKLRRADIDASAGAVEEIARIVRRIRAAWPRVGILLRADSGFAREELMAWAEANGVDYLFGLARNARLVAQIAPELARAQAAARRSKRAERRFADFSWTTRTSWSRPRRVVAKAEWMPGREDGANPRFVVTSLAADAVADRLLYEKLYCARGDMENRIKECQPDLFADRTSAATMRANQLRLWFASMAYVLVSALRRRALGATSFARATCGTIRAKLFKIGALVTVSVRRVRVAMASACPYAGVFRHAHRRLCR